MLKWSANLRQSGQGYPRGKDSLSKNWCWQTWKHTFQKMKLNHFLIPFIKKWIKDFNVRPETIKLLEQNIGSKLFGIALSNIFLDICPWLRETRKKKQMRLHQLKSFCTVKETVNKMKRQSIG